MSDFLILHRHCVHAQSGGYVCDSYLASQECSICCEQFGYNVPIMYEDSVLTVHMSCAIEGDYPAPLKPDYYCAEEIGCAGCEIERAHALSFGQTGVGHTCGRANP